MWRPIQKEPLSSAPGKKAVFLHHISNIYDLTPIIEKFQDLLIIFSFLCHPLGPVLAHAGSVAVAAAVDRKGSNAIFIGPLVFYVDKPAGKGLPTLCRCCRPSG